MNKKTVLPLACFVLLAVLLYRLTLHQDRLHHTLVNYQVPAVILRNQHGQPVQLQEYLNAELPVMLEFIFTTCSTLCSNRSVIFSNVQKKIIAKGDPVRLVSITVDPETDTPEVVSQYLQRYQAQPGWDFLTGSSQDIKRVMDAFFIKSTDMITHDSSLLLRSPKTGQWTRIDGQLGSKDVMNEYLRLEK